MKLILKSKSITYSPTDKYYGTNYWFHNKNETFLLNKKDGKTELFLVLNENEWLEISSKSYTIKNGSTGFSKNIPIEITLPDNYKELIRAIHIAEYLLLDIACIAGGFLNEEVSSVDAIDVCELYL